MSVVGPAANKLQFNLAYRRPAFASSIAPNSSTPLSVTSLTPDYAWSLPGIRNSWTAVCADPRSVFCSSVNDTRPWFLLDMGAVYSFPEDSIELCFPLQRPFFEPVHVSVFITNAARPLPLSVAASPGVRWLVSNASTCVRSSPQTPLLDLSQGFANRAPPIGRYVVIQLDPGERPLCLCSLQVLGAVQTRSHGSNRTTDVRQLPAKRVFQRSGQALVASAGAFVLLVAGWGAHALAMRGDPRLEKLYAGRARQREAARLKQSRVFIDFSKGGSGTVIAAQTP